MQWGNVPLWIATVTSVIFGVRAWLSERAAKRSADQARDDASRSLKAAEDSAAAAVRTAQALERQSAFDEKKHRLELHERDAPTFVIGEPEPSTRDQLPQATPEDPSAQRRAFTITYQRGQPLKVLAVTKVEMRRGREIYEQIPLCFMSGMLSTAPHVFPELNPGDDAVEFWVIPSGQPQDIECDLQATLQATGVDGRVWPVTARYKFNRLRTVLADRQTHSSLVFANGDTEYE